MLGDDDTISAETQAYSKAYYQKNREEILGRNKAYRQKHREEIMAQKKEYYQTNREKILEHEKSPEFRQKYNEQRRERRRTHPEYREKENEGQRERYRTDPEYRKKILEEQKEKYHTDPEYRQKVVDEKRKKYRTDPVYRRQIIDKGGERHRIAREETVKILGPVCACCGESNPLFLDVCRVNLDVEDQIELQVGKRNRIRFYQEVARLADPMKYQVLCLNCWRGTYHRGNGICPHKTNIFWRAPELTQAWERVFQVYGRVCACCGESNPLLLSIDHINNDGKKDRIEIGRGGVRYLNNIARRADKTRYRIFCFNCNIGRDRTENGICPHKIAERELRIKG